MRVLFLLIVLSFVSVARAQNAQDIYSNILISDEIKVKEAEKKALDDAKNLSLKNVDRMKVKSSVVLPKKKMERKEPQKKVLTSPAPFGLLWGADITTIKDMGIKLSLYPQEDYVNSFEATYLPKSIKGFQKVVVAFGEADSLWRILAYGDFIKDDASASKSVREYKKYYAMLSQKYGNAQEFYTGLKKEVDRKQVEEKIGNPDFLAQLQSGQAVLYATFYNKDIGVALSINVDGNNQAYLVIDYKNLKLFEMQEKQTIDAL